jgi:hypothetical protein
MYGGSDYVAFDQGQIVALFCFFCVDVVNQYRSHQSSIANLVSILTINYCPYHHAIGV